MAIWKPTQDPEDIYLAHHGILGQKWGKRNGPPYPLSANAHSSAEKKAGYKKSIKAGKKIAKYEKKISKRENANTKLQKKVHAYEIKSARMERLAEAAHAKFDVKKANRPARRSARMHAKAERIQARADKLTNNPYKQALLSSEAERYELLSKKYKLKAERISRTAAWHKYSYSTLAKSYKAKINAERCRQKNKTQ